MTSVPLTAAPIMFDCQTCGACCAYSDTWPRFTLEDEAAIARIPPALVNDAGNGMRCTGDRCAALYLSAHGINEVRRYELEA